MDIEPLIDELADLLAVPATELAPHAELAGFGNWDSLTKVTLIGFLVDQYSLHVDPERVDGLRTVDDLLQLVQDPALVAAS